MAKRKFHEKVETWIIVTVIAVLVWLYAEATVLKEDSKVIQVRFTEPTNSYAVSPRADQNVRVSFKASSGQWQQFQEMTGQPLIITVDASPNVENQEIFVQLADELMSTELGELGITDLVAEPEVMAVNLREIQEMSLDVELNTAGARLESFDIQPSSITVQAPADIVEQFQSQKVTAVLSPDETADKEPGQEAIAPRVTIAFPEGLDPGGSPWITAVVRDVQISYTLADNDQSTVKERLPIFVSLPVDQQNSYIVELDRQTLSDVTISGPAEVIAGIESDDPRYAVWAEIKLDNLAQLPQTTVVRPVIVGGPAVRGISSDHPATVGIEANIRLRSSPTP